MTNTSFANYQLRSHIRKSQIEMYKEKKDEEHFCQAATLGKYNGFSYKEYESQVCTAATRHQPVLWKRGRRVYSSLQC